MSSPTLAQRIVERVAGRSGPDRRGFLRGTTLGAAALATTPWSFLTRPASAYDAVCGSHSTCSSGYTVFCCTVNGGSNTCPPDSFVAGWWKADNASLCGGAARYYIDCNAFRNQTWRCRCNDDPGTCDNRLVACNQFRYGQCNTQVPWENTGPVVCRLVSCTPPWQEYAGVCSSASRTDNNTTTHSAPCLGTAPTPPADDNDPEDDMTTRLHLFKGTITPQVYQLDLVTGRRRWIPSEEAAARQAAGAWGPITVLDQGVFDRLAKGVVDIDEDTGP